MGSTVVLLDVDKSKSLLNELISGKIQVSNTVEVRGSSILFLYSGRFFANNNRNFSAQFQGGRIKAKYVVEIINRQRSKKNNVKLQSSSEK